uniref:Uncharacterized protein n=1 Tax=Romanomermis culicivorax TaxID=13658 RepID=A0A915JZ93_ROMCU
MEMEKMVKIQNIEELILQSMLKGEPAAAVRSDHLFNNSHITTLKFIPGSLHAAEWNAHNVMSSTYFLLWDVELFACLQIFPHPSFVYTVLVLDDATFLSGCYDGTPEKELVGHEAGVNCLYLSPDRKTLFSGDFRGKIMTWIKANDDHNWQFKGKLSINEVSEKSIDTLMLSTDGRRLFVYCRDKIIYVVDTRSYKSTVSQITKSNFDSVWSFALRYAHNKALIDGLYLSIYIHT